MKSISYSYEKNIYNVEKNVANANNWNQQTHTTYQRLVNN